jgi:ribosomal protein S25
MKEIQKDKYITPSIITTRFRVSCSLAKKLLIELSEQKIVKKIKYSSKESVFTKLE